MDVLAQKIERIGDAIWAFPIGLVLLLAVYFAIAGLGRGKGKGPPPDEPAPLPDTTTQSLAPSPSRLGCVWTLAGVWITLWVFLILRA